MQTGAKKKRSRYAAVNYKQLTAEVINAAHMAASKHRYRDMVQNTGYAIKLIPWLGIDVCGSSGNAG